MVGSKNQQEQRPALSRLTGNRDSGLGFCSVEQQCKAREKALKG